MERRRFLKGAAIGSAALAAMGKPFSALAREDNQTNFHFLAFSKVASPATPTPSDPRHQIAMSGDGKVTPRQVVGDGSFVHYLFPGANPSPGGTPLTIVSSGNWKAKRLVSLNLIGTWGVFASGILEMDINLIQEIPSRDVIPAVLKVVCNIGPAGLVNFLPGTTTPDPEGFTLSIPGTQFASNGTLGPFKPFGAIAGVPGVGLTVFSIEVEERD